MKASAKTKPDCEEKKDHFVTGLDGVRFAGTQVFGDYWGARRLKHPKRIKAALCKAAQAAGATVLHCRFHKFKKAGVSGVIVLAESHISIHTWPERRFAAVDVFMCGECDPHKSMEVLRRFFRPNIIWTEEVRRGAPPDGMAHSRSVSVTLAGP